MPNSACNQCCPAACAAFAPSAAGDAGASAALLPPPLPLLTLPMRTDARPNASARAPNTPHPSTSHNTLSSHTLSLFTFYPLRHFAHPCPRAFHLHPHTRSSRTRTHTRTRTRSARTHPCIHTALARASSLPSTHTRTCTHTHTHTHTPATAEAHLPQMQRPVFFNTRLPERAISTPPGPAQCLCTAKAWPENCVSEHNHHACQIV